VKLWINPLIQRTRTQKLIKFTIHACADLRSVTRRIKHIWNVYTWWSSVELWISMFSQTPIPSKLHNTCDYITNAILFNCTFINLILYIWHLLQSCRSCRATTTSMSNLSPFDIVNHLKSDSRTYLYKPFQIKKLSTIKF